MHHQLLMVMQEPTVHFYSLRDPEPERGLAWFVLNAFLLVGIALAITIGLGIAFGAFRAWLIQKYPDNRFNGNGDELQLDIDPHSDANRSRVSE